MTFLGDDDGFLGEGGELQVEGGEVSINMASSAGSTSLMGPTCMVEAEEESSSGMRMPQRDACFSFLRILMVPIENVIRVVH